MSRQEKQAKEAAKVEVKFEVILAKAKETVARNQEARDKSWKRPEDMSKPEWKVSCAVRVMREQGIAWWQIAYSLGLPGSADNVAKGKSGASYARRLYSRAFGALPEGVRASSRGSATRAAAVVGKFFTDAHTDQEIIEMVLGKKLVWRIEFLDETGTAYLSKEDEAVVSPKKAQILLTSDGGRAVRFNSPVKSDDGPLIWFPGPERTVRVDSILQVLEGIPARARVL